MYSCLWPCSLAITSTGQMAFWFYVQEHPKAQPAVVLILKSPRRGGHRLKFLNTISPKFISEKKRLAYKQYFKLILYGFFRYFIVYYYIHNLLHLSVFTTTFYSSFRVPLIIHLIYLWHMLLQGIYRNAFVCLDAYIQVNNFSVMSDDFPSSWIEPVPSSR